MFPVSPTGRSFFFMRRFLMRGSTLAISCGLLALCLICPGEGTQAGGQKEPDKAALNRTRKQVKMLDDIYKSVVVTITTKYVKKKEDYPAGRAVIHLFRAINEKGWHEVHLLDVSGQPYNPDNVAKDAFEK